MSYKDYPISADTTPEAEALLFKLLAKKSPAEKLRMVSRMNAMVRDLSLSGLRQRHPDDDAVQLKVRLAELLYGSAIASNLARKFECAKTSQ
jgi:hypothetical protein